MVFVKPQNEITENFITGAGQAPARYKKGVQRADWQGPAGSEEAESNFASGISEAVAAKSRQRGIQAISNSDWSGKAASVGAERIGKGMRDSAGKQATNWQESRSFLEGLSLPPRTRNATENVQNRSIPVAQGLQDLKRARKGTV